MTTAIRTERGTYLDIVESPDDGGWYIADRDLENHRSRVSKRIYPSEEAALQDIRSGKVKWEKW